MYVHNNTIVSIGNEHSLGAGFPELTTMIPSSYRYFDLSVGNELMSGSSVGAGGHPIQNSAEGICFSFSTFILKSLNFQKPFPLKKYV